MKLFNIAKKVLLGKMTEPPKPLTIDQMVGMDVTRVDRSDIDTVLSFAGSDDYVYTIRLVAPIWQGTKITAVKEWADGSGHSVSFSNGSILKMPSDKVSNLNVSK